MFTFAPTVLNSATAAPSPAADIIAEILTVGGTLSSTEQDALTDYVDVLVSGGVWSKRILLYGLMGGTANAHAINWANLSSNTLTYQGTAATHSSQGLQFNGGWAETDYFASAGNFALSGYSQDNDIRLGTIDTGSAAARFYAGIIASPYQFNAVNSTPENGGSLIASANHFVNQRINSTALESYIDGALIATYSGSAVTGSSEVLLGILRLGGSPSFPQASTSMCQHYGIWQALSASEITTLHNAEVALQTALGRN